MRVSLKSHSVLYLPPGHQPPNMIFADKHQINVISWNVCGVTNYAKLTQLKSYISSHHPNIIFLQEAFPGRPLNPGQAPPLSGYMSYAHFVRNGLLTYIHCSLPHRLLRTSTDNNTTYQLFQVSLGSSVIQLCNVYSAPTKLNPDILPPPTVRGIVYMGDFNSRHSDLGDIFGSYNRNGLLLRNYIHNHNLTRWDTGGATHSRGGTLDPLLSAGLIASRVKCFAVPALFSDHIALNFNYSLPANIDNNDTRIRISVPPKYCPNYISYMTSKLPSFSFLFSKPVVYRSCNRHT